MKGRPYCVSVPRYSVRAWRRQAPAIYNPRDEFSRIGFCGRRQYGARAHRRLIGRGTAASQLSVGEPAPGARESLARDFKVRVSADNRAQLTAATW